MLRCLPILIAIAGCHTTAVKAPLEEGTTTTCYAGSSNIMGKTSHSIARRTLDPAAHRITEQVTEDAQAAHGARAFEVVMIVDGDHFTMKETRGAFTGTGTLVGAPWQWTSWTSIATIPGGIEVVSDDALTDKGLTARKQIRKGAQQLATVTEELVAFDCATYDDRVAALTAPTETAGALDRASCDRACRNFASLEYWDHANVELEAAAPDQRDAMRAEKAAALTKLIEGGIEGCIRTCATANNGEQTRCLGAAKTVEEARACS